MTTWAQLDKENKVVNIISVAQHIADPKDWLVDRFGGEWQQTFTQLDVDNKKDKVRFKYPAVIGGAWDSKNKVFVSKKPYDSWVLDEDFLWQPPVDEPNDGKLYYWDEEKLNWVEQTLE